MTIDDLTRIARLWIEDHHLPEPGSLTVSTTGRIDVHYFRGECLPDIGWRDSTNGACDVHESEVGGVAVWVYALKAVTA